MSDIGEDFQFMKELGKAKRAQNTCTSTKILTDRNITFESKNDGKHLVVFKNKFVVDFWPATGKFICRTTRHSARGVFTLLKYIDEKI